jgi:hypothetical protein
VFPFPFFCARLIFSETKQHKLFLVIHQEANRYLLLLSTVISSCRSSSDSSSSRQRSKSIFSHAGLLSSANSLSQYFAMEITYFVSRMKQVAIQNGSSQMLVH